MKKREWKDLEIDVRKDPYSYMCRLIFSRWKPFILRAMDFDDGNFTHFSRFMKQIPISAKVLSENLKEMEADGLIIRTVLHITPPQVEYRLSDIGRTLIPILDAVYDWGWHDMKRKGLEIDALGEMWHGYRERDEEFMEHPYRNKK